MTIQRWQGVGLGAVREIVAGAVDLPVIVELTNFRLDEGLPTGPAVIFDVMRNEVVKGGGYMLVCQNPECGQTFESARADAKYHVDNCRLRHFRAQKRLAATDASAPVLPFIVNGLEGETADQAFARISTEVPDAWRNGVLFIPHALQVES